MPGRPFLSFFLSFFLLRLCGGRGDLSRALDLLCVEMQSPCERKKNRWGFSRSGHVRRRISVRLLAPFLMFVKAGEKVLPSYSSQCQSPPPALVLTKR